MPTNPTASRPTCSASSWRRWGYPCDTQGDIADSRERLTPVPGIAGLAPLITATAGTPTRIAVSPDGPRSAVILAETGDERDVRLHAYRDGVEVPAISEPGYHRLLIGQREIVLAVAPARASGVGDLPRARAHGGWRRKSTGCAARAMAASATSRRWRNSPRQRRGAGRTCWR